MIVTFYSFKGGVGRSFTLVETAAQLAALGRSVVVWDLDLEAPGLQKIPLLRSLDAGLKTGTLDILRKFLDDGYVFPEKLLIDALLPLPLPPEIAEADGACPSCFPASSTATMRPGSPPSTGPNSSIPRRTSDWRSSTRSLTPSPISSATRSS